MNIIRIGSLEFDAEDRDTWSAIDLVGWKSGPPMRATVEDRPNGDGAFGIAKAYRSARVLRFVGVLEGGTVAAQLALEDAFAAIQSDGRPIVVSVENEAGLRSVTASLQGVPEVEVDPDHRGATVRATFICYDPVKYGPESVQSTGLPSQGGGLEYPLGDPDGALYYGDVGSLGRVTLTNVGTAEVWPVFTVSGLLDQGFEIRCIDSGDVLRYDRVVPAGTTVTVDSRTGAVLIDGVSDGSTYLTRDQFFSVPAGGSCEVQFSAIGTGDSSASLVASVRPGWW